MDLDLGQPYTNTTTLGPNDVARWYDIRDKILDGDIPNLRSHARQIGDLGEELRGLDENLGNTIPRGIQGEASAVADELRQALGNLYQSVRLNWLSLAGFDTDDPTKFHRSMELVLDDAAIFLNWAQEATRSIYWYYAKLALTMGAPLDKKGYVIFHLAKGKLIIPDFEKGGTKKVRAGQGFIEMLNKDHSAIIIQLQSRFHDNTVEIDMPGEVITVAPAPVPPADPNAPHVETPEEKAKREADEEEARRLKQIADDEAYRAKIRAEDEAERL